MTAILFKDITTNSVHVPTALGNEDPKKPKKKPVPKPVPKTLPPPIDVDKHCAVLKVDDSLGLVLGWAIVCKKDDADYYDLQDDHIPEDAMLQASVNFMQNSRIARDMHEGGHAGDIVFAFPMTTDVASAFGVETSTTGLMVAMKPNDASMLAKFKSGEYSGFSIGGARILDEDA